MARARVNWKAIGQRLKVIRLQLGISEIEAAAACEVSLPTYRQYEAGRPQRFGGAVELAIKYDVNLDWLVLGEGTKLARDFRGRPTAKSPSSRSRAQVGANAPRGALHSTRDFRRSGANSCEGSASCPTTLTSHDRTNGARGPVPFIEECWSNSVGVVGNSNIIASRLSAINSIFQETHQNLKPTRWTQLVPWLLDVAVIQCLSSKCDGGIEPLRTAFHCNGCALKARATRD